MEGKQVHHSPAFLIIESLTRNFFEPFPSSILSQADSIPDMRIGNMSLFYLRILIRPSLIVLLMCCFFEETDASNNHNHDACKQGTSCGNVSVTYPFWTKNESCGRKGFKIDCDGDQPFFDFIFGRYHVLKIEVNDHWRGFLELQPTDHFNSSCLPDFQYSSSATPNPSPKPTIPPDRSIIPIGQDKSNISMTVSIFHHCNSSFLIPEHALPLICADHDGTHRSYVALEQSHHPPAPEDMPYKTEERACSSHFFMSIKLELSDFNQATNAINYKRFFEGKSFTLSWPQRTGEKCTECRRSGGECGRIKEDPLGLFQCFCPHGDEPHKCPKGRNGGYFIDKIAFIAVASGTVLLLLSMTGFYCCTKKGIGLHRLANKNDRVIEDFMNNYGSITPKRFSYSSIKRMTSSFREKLGQGGFGAVYKGELPNKTHVAVKILSLSNRDGQDFINEVASISRTSHVNIVSLLGFCFEGQKRALIYEYMSNGSLDKHIYEDSRKLGRQRLYDIAIGIARGLAYLHVGCNTRIVHFDIKPHNILLDGDFCPKISDFGLSKLCLKRESIVSMLVARGTIGHIAPEVISSNFGGVSHKSDVYSYGMMLIEMIGGRKNLDVRADRSSEMYFPDHVYRLIERGDELGHTHGRIPTPQENEVARKMALVGIWCIQADPSRRPSMTRVIEMLEGSIDAVLIPPKPFLFSPARSPPADSPSASSTLL